MNNWERIMQLAYARASKRGRRMAVIGQRYTVYAQGSCIEGWHYACVPADQKYLYRPAGERRG